LQSTADLDVCYMNVHVLCNITVTPGSNFYRVPSLSCNYPLEIRQAYHISTL